MRTIPGIGDSLKAIDEIITTKLIPAISGGIIPNDIERSLFSLPPSSGGLGIPIFSEIAEREFKNYQMLTECLQNNNISQTRQSVIDQAKLKKLKSTIKGEKVKRQRSILDSIKENVSDEMMKLIDLCTERGALLWLSTLPIKEEGYQLDKQSFWDLLKIRY